MCAYYPVPWCCSCRHLQFNPNLYNCGKVCLSLLGTWSGGQGESWDPQASSAFQVGQQQYDPRRTGRMQDAPLPCVPHIVCLPNTARIAAPDLAGVSTRRAETRYAVF